MLAQTSKCYVLLNCLLVTCCEIHDESLMFKTTIFVTKLRKFASKRFYMIFEVLTLNFNLAALQQVGFTTKNAQENSKFSNFFRFSVSKNMDFSKMTTLFKIRQNFLQNALFIALLWLSRESVKSAYLHHLHLEKYTYKLLTKIIIPHDSTLNFLQTPYLTIIVLISWEVAKRKLRKMLSAPYNQNDSFHQYISH